MRVTCQDRQLGDPNAVVIQQHRRQRLNRKLDICVELTEIVNESQKENDRSRPKDSKGELRQGKFAHPEMPRHPMRQQSDAPERQENRDSAQPRYGPGVNMPIGRWQTCQTMPDRIIADQSRENSREQKCGQKYNNLHGFSCSATSEDWNYWLAGQGGYGLRLPSPFTTPTTAWPPGSAGCRTGPTLGNLRRSADCPNSRRRHCAPPAASR